MYCPKCGVENPDSAQACRSCGAQLSPPPAPQQGTPYGPSAGLVPKTSRLALAAFACYTAAVSAMSA